MEELYRSCTLPLNKLLIERNISFVNEFFQDGEVFILGLFLVII